MAKSVAERREIVEKYLQRVANGSAAEVMELFAAEPTLEDPVGGDVKDGRAAVEEFYRSIQDLEMSTTLREFRASGDHAAAFLFDVATKIEGATMTVSAIEVMTFDDEGLVTSMKAYWHADADMAWS